MTSEMELVVAADGVARCIYDEALDLREIGTLKITRAVTSSQTPRATGGRIWGLLVGRFWGRSGSGRRR